MPDTYREGSFGLGAGRLRTVFRMVLPSAVPGILAGIILAIGRIVGETAALIYTAGTVAEDARTTLMSSGRTLAVHMYVLSNEGLHTERGLRHSGGAAGHWCSASTRLSGCELPRLESALRTQTTCWIECERRSMIWINLR